MTDDQRKAWNQKQKQLRKALEQPDSVTKAIELFFEQHAALHSADLAPDTPWSYADKIFSGVTEADLRRIPKNRDHSLAWCLWHMARIEDVTMNLLVGGRPQVIHSGDWVNRLKAGTEDTGNDMDTAAVVALSEELDIVTLPVYRLAVGRRTREIVSNLSGQDFKQRVDPAGIQKIIEQGAVPAGSGLLDYWGRRTTAGLLLMPPTRHNMVHLNEAMEIKDRIN